MKIEKNKDIQPGIIAAQSLEKQVKLQRKKIKLSHLNSTQMWKARTTKTIFLLLAGYLGLQCIRASLWIPLILCILLFTFIIQLKNKEL